MVITQRRRSQSTVITADKVGEFGDIQNPPLPPEEGFAPTSVQHAGATGDMEPSFTFVAGHGGDRWVISSGGHISLWDGAEVLGHKALGTFAPTYGHGCVQAGDIDPSMSPEPASGSTPGKLRVIDATGTWWEVDPTGKPTFIRNGVGAHSLIAANASTLSGSGGTGARSWSTLPFGTSTVLASTPYLPTGAPAGTWAVASGNARPFVSFQQGQSGQTGHWVLPKAASYVDGSTRWCAWWQMAPIGYANLIQRLTYTVDANNAVVVQDLWGSTGPDRFGAPRLRWPDTHPDYLKTLRSEIAPAMPHHMLGIAIGRVLPTQTVPQIIATNMGGRVMVLHGDTGAILTESADYGIGGMALTVANVQGDAHDEIIFAPHYSPIPHLGGSVRSHIHVLQGTPQGGLTHVGAPPPVPVAGNLTDDFLGYGACGMAVVDLAPLNLEPPLGKVILVTTLNGELAVFQQNDGVLDPSPLYRRIVEGSIGVFGSIVVANLDPSSAKPELYLAGSSGIRRFDFQ